jgi:hypothetical protein
MMMSKPDRQMTASGITSWETAVCFAQCTVLSSSGLIDAGTPAQQAIADKQQK